MYEQIGVREELVLSVTPSAPESREAHRNGGAHTEANKKTTAVDSSLVFGPPEKRRSLKDVCCYRRRIDVARLPLGATYKTTAS